MAKVVESNPDRFMRSYYLTCPFHESVAFSRMVDHAFLSDDSAVQRTVFDSGHTVVVNFVERLQKVRKGFTEQRPWIDPKNPKEESFFSDVKLVSVVAGSARAGLGTVNFKIVGSLR